MKSSSNSKITVFDRRADQTPVQYIQSPEFYYYALGVRLATQLYALRQAMWSVYCPATLAGTCGVAAEIITIHLQGQDIDAQFREGFYRNAPHCWTQVGGHVIDVTQTQFEIHVAPVFVRPKTRRYHGGLRLEVPPAWGVGVGEARVRRRLQARALTLAHRAWKAR